MNRNRSASIPVLLLVLNSVAASIGLLFPEIYREPAVAMNAMSKATFFANDLLSLLVAIPAMAIAWLVARIHHSTRAHLLWLGGIFYTVYNLSFYLFCVDLNLLFPIYLAAFAIGLTYLVVEIQRLEIDAIGQKMKPGAAARRTSAIHALVFATLLVATWSIEWIGQIHARAFDPVTSGFMKNVATIDITLLVPGLLFTAIRLWKNDPWGIVSGIILNTGIWLYMAVLAIACAMQARGGMPQAMAEFPVWVVLSAASFSSAALLIRDQHRRHVRLHRPDPGPYPS